MEESILNSIKKLLGIASDYTNFDQDILIHINSAFATLSQLGVGPLGGFRISDDQSTWSEYMLPEDNIESVKTYVYLKVKLVFDPPLNSSVMEAMKETVRELEWRLNVEGETNISEIESIPDDYIESLN